MVEHDTFLDDPHPDSNPFNALFLYPNDNNIATENIIRVANLTIYNTPLLIFRTML